MTKLWPILFQKSFSVNVNCPGQMKKQLHHLNFYTKDKGFYHPKLNLFSKCPDVLQGTKYEMTTGFGSMFPFQYTSTDGKVKGISRHIVEAFAKAKNFEIIINNKIKSLIYNQNEVRNGSCFSSIMAILLQFKTGFNSILNKKL